MADPAEIDRGFYPAFGTAGGNANAALLSTSLRGDMRVCFERQRDRKLRNE